MAVLLVAAVLGDLAWDYNVSYRLLPLVSHVTPPPLGASPGGYFQRGCGLWNHLHVFGKHGTSF